MNPMDNAVKEVLDNLIEAVEDLTDVVTVLYSRLEDPADQDEVIATRQSLGQARQSVDAARGLFSQIEKETRSR
ncbi:MAG TPA: hypothetical protein VKB58_10735 [Terriglobales bacterium]|jgi:hypothetical protein|nr:hypothetical protein [Terriglobales bacterium]